MNALFSDAFMKSLNKFISLKKVIKSKVDAILENPVRLGEPLKGHLRGYYSCPVKKNFLIIYQYCRVCRKKGDEEIVQCGDCDQCSDDTVRFIDIGPHDRVYSRR